MTATLESATELVQQLICSCRRAHEGFRCAARTVNDEDMRRLFSIYAQQRTRFAEELRQHLSVDQEIEAQPNTAWEQMEANEALRECLEAEEQSLALYSQVLATDEVPTRAHFLISAQFSLLQRVHDRVQGMFATTHGSNGTKG